MVCRGHNLLNDVIDIKSCRRGQVTKVDNIDFLILRSRDTCLKEAVHLPNM